MNNYNPDVHTLGVLCVNGHDWNATGKSLRYKSNRSCFDCTKNSVKCKGKKVPEETNFLGRLCKRKHEYENTGQTLRTPYGQCIECEKLHRRKPEQVEYDRQWRENNRQHTRKYHQIWESNNKDKIKVYLEKKKSRPDHLLKCRLNARRWYGKNLEWARSQQLIRTRRRQAKKLNNHHSVYTSIETELRFSDFNGQCAYCGQIANSLDHLIPVSKGGPDVMGNLIPACMSCNSAKQDKDAYQWYSSQVFFSKKRWQKILNILGIKNLGQLPLF